MFIWTTHGVIGLVLLALATLAFLVACLIALVAKANAAIRRQFKKLWSRLHG
ncbi:hypothetical protein [Dyella silvatica]|uniref:hypothetical protein n=1 Tax=Dyella silvatica TaxID=2992128 RepID=UPI002253EB16|nr:hypothetical protein [Dyella silvatica]